VLIGPAKLSRVALTLAATGSPDGAVYVKLLKIRNWFSHEYPEVVKVAIVLDTHAGVADNTEAAASRTTANTRNLFISSLVLASAAKRTHQMPH
jgi:hypothetical protein